MVTTSTRRAAKSSARAKDSERDGDSSNGNRNANGRRGTNGNSSGLSGFINSGLSSSFEAIRDKVAQTISDNGQQYLDEAVDKIKETTSQVVEWSKKNPIKLAVGVAALMAVSAFLVHTMKSEGDTASSRSNGHAKQGAGKTRSAKA